MASSLAARQAARQAMPPAINQQDPQQPQGFLNRNAGRIGAIADVAEPIGRAGAQFAGNYLFGQGANALEEKLRGLQNPDANAEAVGNQIKGKLNNPNFNLDQQKPAGPDTNSQLSDALKQLMNQRLGDMEEGHGKTNPQIWQQQAYNTANNQTGQQGTPAYVGAFQFPWEQDLSGAINRYNAPDLGGTDLVASEENQPGANPNEGRNEALRLAPAGGAAGGALIGAGIGSVVPVVGTAVGAGVGGLAGYAAGRAAQNKFTVAPPKRYT